MNWGGLVVSLFWFILLLSYVNVFAVILTERGQSLSETSYRHKYRKFYFFDHICLLVNLPEAKMGFINTKILIIHQI